METIQSVAVGLGLAAACGFRVFLPLAGLGIASGLGWVTPAPGFAWIATTPALIAFGTAAVAEIAGYYLPWVDHALDALATPAAVLAGVLAAAATVTDLPPLLKWAVALIGGGGVAGLIQGVTVATRFKSGLLTGGFANPVVATIELIAAVTTVLLALLAPLVALVAIAGLIGWGARAVHRLRFGRGRRPYSGAGNDPRPPRAR